MYKVVVDIYPRTIQGTNGCHKYVFDSYKTKKQAQKVSDEINENGTLGKACVEKK